MRPWIAPVVSKEKDGPQVEFTKNGLTATYTVTGNASDYKIELL